MPEITRDADHVYRVDGVITPGVSEILQPFCDFSRIPRDVLELKRALGKAVHKSIELFEDGDLDFETVDDEVLPYLEAWQKFKNDVPIKVRRSECFVYSQRHRYCGQLDLVVDWFKKLALVDLKCVVAMQPQTALQTAAYAQAYKETYGETVDLRYGLQLKPDGTYRLYPYSNKSDFNIFLNALNLRSWVLNNK